MAMLEMVCVVAVLTHRFNFSLQPGWWENVEKSWPGTEFKMDVFPKYSPSVMFRKLVPRPQFI